MPASDTEVLRPETSIHQILKHYAAVAQGMLHGKPAIAAGKRADIVYELATVCGTSGKKDCVPPKQTPQSYFSKPFITHANL